jgi:hypothetical protein
MVNQKRPLTPSRAADRRAAVMLGTLLSCGVVACTPDDRPVLFNHVSEQGPNGGNLVHEHFAKLYRIIDVDDRKQRYTPPKNLAGLERPQPVFGQDHCLPESAWILFVVTTQGGVTSPQVIEASSTLLSKRTIERAEKMRFQPATLDGNPIPAVADFHFVINCPTAPGHRP